MLRRNIMVAALSRVGILVLIGLGGQSALFGNKESADSSSDDAIRALFHSKQREFSTLVEWIKEDRVLNTLGLDVRRPYYRFDPPTGSFVPEGEISSDRWESYRKLLKTMGITMPVNIWRAGGVIRIPLFAAGRAGGVSTYKGIAFFVGPIDPSIFTPMNSLDAPNSFKGDGYYISNITGNWYIYVEVDS